MEDRIQVSGRGRNIYDKWQEAIYQCQMMNGNLEKYIDAEFQTPLKGTYLDRFRYNFNAFVNASRGVTFVLQKIYNKEDGFTEWYTEKQSILKENTFASQLVQLRNFNQKQGNDYPQINVSFKINGDYQFTSTMSGVPVKEHDDKRIPNNVVNASFEEIEKTAQELYDAGDFIEMDFPEGLSLEELAQLAAPILIQQKIDESHRKNKKWEDGIMERTDFQYKIVLNDNVSLTIEEFKTKCFENLQLLGSICGEAQQKFEKI